MEIREEFNQWFETKTGKKLNVKAPLLKATFLDAIKLVQNTKFDGKLFIESEDRTEVMEMIFENWRSATYTLVENLTNPNTNFNFTFTPMPKTENERRVILDEMSEIEKALKD